MKKKYNPYTDQVGGSHYKNYPIQPMQFFIQNKIPKAVGDIIQDVLRDKGDRIQNLLKAKHIIDMLIKENTSV